jgi:hypothetical protein
MGYASQNDQPCGSIRIVVSFIEISAVPARGMLYFRMIRPNSRSDNREPALLLANKPLTECYILIDIPATQFSHYV